MTTLESLRRQIDTATDLGSVVTTMKTLAAVSIRQYESAVDALQDYSRTIDWGFQIALAGEAWRTAQEPAGDRTAVVVWGSDQGMCGQFNEETVSLFRSHWVNAPDDMSPIILSIGGRVEGLLQEAGWPIHRHYHVPSSVTEITSLVHDVLPELVDLTEHGRASRLALVYHRRLSASTSRPHQVQLLPIEHSRLEAWHREPWESRSLPTYASDQRKLLSQLVRHYLYVGLYRATAESLASENARRIAAMQAAEKNIDERLAELRGAWNHLRQSAITAELLEVLTGFEALSQPQRPR